MSTGLDAVSSGQIFRKDHPQILAAKRELAYFQGVRLKYRSEGYVAGQVLGRYTSGPYSGLFDKYDDGGASGIQTAACVLFESVDLSAASSSYNPLARGIFKGLVFKSKLTGLDANAETDLKARTLVGSDGVEVLEF